MLHPNFHKPNLHFVYGGRLNTDKTLAIAMHDITLEEKIDNSVDVVDEHVIQALEINSNAERSELESLSGAVEHFNPFDALSNDLSEITSNTNDTSDFESDEDIQVLLSVNYKEFIDSRLNALQLFTYNKDSIYTSIFENIPNEQRDRLTIYFNSVYPLFKMKQLDSFNVQDENEFVLSKLRRINEIYTLSKQSKKLLLQDFGHCKVNFPVLFQIVYKEQLDFIFPSIQIESRSDATNYVERVLEYYNESCYKVFLSFLNNRIPFEYLTESIAYFNILWSSNRPRTLEGIIKQMDIPSDGSMKDYLNLVDEIFDVYILNNEIQRKGLKKKKNKLFPTIIDLLDIPKSIKNTLLGIDEVGFEFNGVNFNENKFKDYLVYFLHSDLQEIHLPPMSKANRAIAHRICFNHKFGSKTSGKGTSRHLTVYKKKDSHIKQSKYVEQPLNDQIFGHSLLLKMGWDGKLKDIVKLTKKTNKKGLESIN